MESQTLPAETYNLLVLLLQEKIGSRLEVVEHQVLNRHTDYFVILLKTHNPDLELVVKLAGSAAPYPCPFDRTAMLHRLITDKTSLIVPEVLGVDVSCREWPWRYLIMTYLPGQEWASVQSKLDTVLLKQAYAQIGEAVAELHLLEFPGFGELSASGIVESEPDFLTALKVRAQRRIKNSVLAARFVNLLEDNATLFASPGPACLVHEDLHPFNLLFHKPDGQWHLLTILDFDKAWAASHEIDLARLELWTGMTGPGFWEGYNRLELRDNLYVERRPFYQLLWCFEYAVNSSRHLEDTRRLCQQLGLSPVIEFV
jgi:aminoglycoside phosphotransferase (APT) family kinase protein